MSSNLLALLGLSDRTIDLVREGIVIIDVNFSKDGTSFLARTTQPHPRLGVQTNHTFVDPETLTSKLAKVTIRKSKDVIPAVETYVSPNRRSSVYSVKDDPLLNPRVEASSSSKIMTMDQAIDLVRVKGYNASYENGVKGFLPSDSLTSYDFRDQNIERVTARCLLVAKKLGTGRLIGRISGDSNLTVRGSKDLHTWWEGARWSQRLALLTNNKKFPLSSVKDEKPAILGSVQAPFQALEAPLVEKEAEEEAEWST
jgi:hypothetical protein